ncbi:hypothetical protein [uncultured Rubinisphaera sp.]|uniref:hypothetical protein n=1 Tax=uncultured Rubinisphaera sp. TaxID=1678686 RepID=UPI0030D6E665
MSIVIMDIPDSKEELGPWLDRKIVDCQLGQFVKELEFIADDFNPPGYSPDSLQEILGSDRDAVLDRGLKSLNYDQCAAFLANPQMLLELQELVLIEGGNYWQNILDQAELPLSSPPRQNKTKSDSSSAPKVHVLKPIEESPKRSKMPWIISIAALGLLAIVAYQYQVHVANPANNIVENPNDQKSDINPDKNSPAPTMLASNWGWDSPDAFNDSLPPDDYLHELADAAGAWFNKRPDSTNDLKQRLAEFRHGCETLLTAKHTALSEDDREWLRTNCKKWAGEIDQMLTVVESKDISEVQKQADQTVNQLIREIRLKADEVA